MEKNQKKQKNAQKNVQNRQSIQKEERSFLYLLPERVTASGLAAVPDFLEPRRIEVWTEVNLLELTLTNGTLTFEDLMPELTAEADQKLLAQMGMKQVYACDYEAADAGEVRRVMECLLMRCGGILASDTQDFQPFLQPQEL